VGKKRFPLPFSAVLLGETKAYLIYPLTIEELEPLPRIESDIANILMDSENILFLSEETGRAFQLHEKYSADDIEVVVVISRILLEAQVLPVPPKSCARILPLADFVTIVDSLEGINEFEKYWGFVDKQTSNCGPMLGNADYFGAFRDTHGVLVEGAITPSMIALDPHWGSNWRYKTLTDF